MQKKLMLLGGIRYLLPAIEAAHKHGIYVITVDYLPNNIAHKYSDEYHNVSILEKDKEKVLALAKELKIDGILSYAVDPGVVAAAYVAEQMGLPFTCSYESVCILQDKSCFRKFLADNGFNAPHAKGYVNPDEAIKDVEYFNWPVIVKPVDSAGSKGVSRVDNPKDLPKAIAHALDESHNGHFIVEDFLELDGYQSSADCFSVDGKLVYADYSDQLFDKDAANPYTPALEIWPSTMKQEHQNYLTGELQRLLTLLNCGTGLYNVGEPLLHNITMPQYDGCYVNDIAHSLKAGTYQGISYDDSFKHNHVICEAIYPSIGDHIEAFHGANNAVGSIFLKFSTREECDEKKAKLSDYIKIKVQ